MATQNDYGLVWMNSNQMMMPEGSGMHQQVPSDMLVMDQGSSMDSTYYPLSIPPPFHSVQQPMELDGILMMDDFDGDYCDEPPRFMTAATQTIPNLRKKIMPVKHPGLKLQTPIAFKCDTDPNVIPIQKDGMAICEKCGAIGVKHAFYTRHRKYCSLACARGILDEGQGKDDKDIDEDSMHSQENSNPASFKFPNGMDIKDEELVTREVLSLDTRLAPTPSWAGSFPFSSLELQDDRVPSLQSMRSKLHMSYNWLPQLINPDFNAAPVNCFKHAPMSDVWDDITVGMKVEVETTDNEETRMEGFTDSFWVATVIRLAGYKALLRYDGFQEGHDFWVCLCSSRVHPVGWCATRGKPLIPPRLIAENYTDWKEFLVRRLTGARTLPSSFYGKVQESLKSRFRIGLNLEVVDKVRISQMCVATIRNIVGKRLHLVYYNAEEDDAGFWCHEDSPLIHHVGWSMHVGHQIDAPDLYMDRCESGLFETDDACEELFTAPFQCVRDWNAAPTFKERMKLEAIDPLNLSAICAATVMRVLRDGYLMIRIDSYSEDGDGSDWFCYHSSSPCIFPPGFCHENGIPLVPPIKYSADTFSWDELARTTGCILAPASLFHREIPEHGFVAGMQLESADLMDPRLVCVATVSRVVGRLLKIHFDGWEEEYDQWMDCSSPDLYPVGWCSLVLHKLEAPRSPQKLTEQGDKKKPGRRGRRVKGKIKNVHCKKQLQMHQEVSTTGPGLGNDQQIMTPEPCVPVLSGLAEVENTKMIAPHPMKSAAEIDGPTTKPAPALVPPTSHENETTFIPRLTDGTGVGEGELNPDGWTCEDVATFLRINDLGAYADNFLSEGVKGSDLLKLAQDEVMKLTAHKFGPTVKILAVIKQLKQKASKVGRRHI